MDYFAARAVAAAPGNRGRSRSNDAGKVLPAQWRRTRIKNRRLHSGSLRRRGQKGFDANDMLEALLFSPSFSVTGKGDSPGERTDYVV